MSWSTYNKKRALAKDLLFKLKETLGLVGLENMAKCQRELYELILKELDNHDTKAKIVS